MGLFDKNKSGSSPTPPISPTTGAPVPGTPRPMVPPPAVPPGFSANQSPNISPKPPVAPGSLPQASKPPVPSGSNNVASAPRPFGTPPTPNSQPSINSKPLFGGPAYSTQPAPAPSGFMTPPPPSSTGNSSNEPASSSTMIRNSSASEYLPEDQSVNEILGIDLAAGRVPKKHLDGNSPVEEVKAYVNSLSTRKQELLRYQSILKNRKQLIDEMIERKGLKKKNKPAAKKKTKASEPKSNTIKVKDKNKTNALVVAKQDNDVNKKTSTKQQPLKVMKHNSNVSTDHLGVVNKPKKPSSIVTKAHNEPKKKTNTSSKKKNAAKSKKK